MGLKDGEVGVDDVLAHLTMLVEASDLPVNADFEAGFADDPDGVAHNVKAALETGIAGLSIEDRTGKELYPIELASERIHAAHRAMFSSGAILVGRSEGFLIGNRDLSATIKRLVAYAEAGADCLYAPGITDMAAIREVVAAVAPKPVNVLQMGAQMQPSELAEIGVRRMSVGSNLAKAAWAGFDKAVDALLA